MGDSISLFTSTELLKVACLVRCFVVSDSKMTASDVEKTTTAESTSPSSKNTSSPSKVEGDVDKRKEAMNHFVAGKRHLLVKDMNSAVTSLALACELLSAEYGETAYECADAYYYYGKALLEMARAESGVFGNALDGESTEEETEDESAEGEEEKDATEEKKEDLEAEKEKKSEEEKETAEKKPEKDVEKEKDSAMETEESEKEKTEEGSQDEKETKDEESVGDGDVDAKEGKDKQEQEAEEEEDPSNLQLSWEMLELAKVAYTNKLATADEEKKLVEMKICEVLLTLGEVSLESETYEQAVADITECLTKRKVLHEADSRRIAETHYHLGVALGHFNKFDEAVSALQAAIECIKLRIENLKNKKESKDESKADDAFYTRETEITELEALLPEIEEKIQDTKDMKEQSKESQAEESTGFANGDNKEDPDKMTEEE